MLCRGWFTFYALSAAFIALTALAVANQLLAALDDEQEAARRRAQEDVTRELQYLIRDTAEKGIVFERDGEPLAFDWARN